VRASDLARAASEHQSAGGRLIDLLVERRYIERLQLLEALRLQTIRLLEQLLRWSQGDFKFYSGDEVSYEEGFVAIPVEELLIHAAQNAPPEPARAVAPAPAGRPAPAPAPAARSAAGWTPTSAAESAPAPPRPVAVPKPAPAMVAPPPQAVDAELHNRFRKMTVEPRAVASRAKGWVGWVLAVVLAALTVSALLRTPHAFMLPFPWQERERQALGRDQRAALYLKIDHAAKTWFLLKGSFPDRLEDLVAAELLSPGDLEDAEGHRLLYSAGEESYTLEPLERGRPVAGAGTTEAITGNFLLDPEFLNVPPEPAVQPLFLLD
jgi:hypothetical protein